MTLVNGQSRSDRARRFWDCRSRDYVRRTALICLLLNLGACAMQDRRVSMVYPQKTTYVDAVALDGGAVDVPPRVVEQVIPRVPADLDISADSVRVIVEFGVDEEGRVAAVLVKESSDERLDAAAIEAIRRWRFEPAKREGDPIPSRATVLLRFDPPAKE